MEQFVLVPASVYNKSLTTQPVTKQELPNNKAEQPLRYQIDSLKRDINKKLLGKADALIDKVYFILFSHQAFKLAHKNLGWCCYWSVNLRLYSTFPSKKRRRFRQLLYLTRRCWKITLSIFSPECQS